jgi:hypothetical protein
VRRQRTTCSIALNACSGKPGRARTFEGFITMLILLAVFVFGFLVGASSWLVAAAWLEAKRECGRPERGPAVSINRD